MRRSAYERRPAVAEALIVEELRRYAEQLDGEVTVEGGWGWADFLISGTIHPTRFGDFLKLLVDFNRVTVDPNVVGEEVVIKRSLTLLGYAWSGEHRPPAIQHPLEALMFIRARPGHLPQIKNLVETRFRETEVRLVDGKIDMVAMMKPVGRPEFFVDHERFSEIESPEDIDKFETHVIFDDVRFENENRSGAAEATACLCSERTPPNYAMSDPLPRMLQNAVKNIEFLFASTMSDPANCCDARFAIDACEWSLHALLASEWRVRREMKDLIEDNAPSTHVQAANNRVVYIHGTIERWIQFSDRILRQRTVGSFEEFLGQSDRAVAYRGGAQKVLFVADNLMNDLLAKVDPENKVPRMTAMYDAVDRIQHLVNTGLVLMPVRSLFFLPGAVADLWHEVGGFHFFKTIEAKDLGLDLSKPKDANLYRDLGDNYGDLVSFLYGFKLDLEHFAAALLEGWLLSQPYSEEPESSRDTSYADILARIVAVAEYGDQLVHAPMPIAREVMLMDLFEDVCDIASTFVAGGLPEPKRLRKEVVDHLMSAPIANGLNVLRSRLGKKDVDAAVAALVNRPPDAVFDFDRPAALREFDSSTDLNDEFRKLHWAVTLERCRSGQVPNAFACTAALTRGAAIEYYKRAAVRDRAEAAKKKSPNRG